MEKHSGLDSEREEGLFHDGKGNTYSATTSNIAPFQGCSPPCMSCAHGGTGSTAWPALTRSCKPG